MSDRSSVFQSVLLVLALVATPIHSPVYAGVTETDSRNQSLLQPQPLPATQLQNNSNTQAWVAQINQAPQQRQQELFRQQQQMQQRQLQDFRQQQQLQQQQMRLQRQQQQQQIRWQQQQQREGLENYQRRENS